MHVKTNLTKEKSFELAVRIVNLVKYLRKSQKETIMSKQLLRCGTSIGANVREAFNAESTPDFVHKLGIAQKECDETCYWLELLNRTQYLDAREFTSIHADAQAMLKIIKSTIITKKAKMRSRTLA